MGPLFIGHQPSLARSERTNEIDCAQNVLGQEAESGFGFDLGYASGEEAPACRLV
jgi:hypothetical protein